MAWVVRPTGCAQLWTARGSPSITVLFVVRHGATQWNVELRAQGQADIPLNDLGRAQARAAGRVLAAYPLDAVYSSDLRRAADTAWAIARVHGLEVVTDADLREIDQGEWTGLTENEIRTRWPERWGPARHYRARPGGESPAQVRDRALSVLRRIARAHPDGSVVVVSHGATIRTLLSESLGLSARASAGVDGVANGGIVELQASLRDETVILHDMRRLDSRASPAHDPNQ